MIPASQHQIAALATFIVTAALALFVLSNGFQHPVKRWFGIYTIAISAWSFCWLKMISSSGHSQSFFWARLLHIPASFIPATFLHFVQYFLNIQSDHKQAFLRRMFYGLGALFAGLCFLKTFSADVTKKLGFHFYLEPGRHYIIFFIFFFAAVIFTSYLLMAAYQKSTGPKKTHIAYVLLAYVVAYAGGAAVFLPAYHIPIPSVTLYTIPLCHLIIAYAIWRHQLMDINVIIRKTLLYSLVSAALASVYAGTITLLAQLLGARHGTAPAFSSVLAAIFITLLFNPLRIRIQRWIESHFPRESLNPGLLQEAAGGFAHEMKRPLSKISLPAELALMDLERVKSGEMAWTDALPKVEERLRFIMGQSIDAGYMIEAIRELSASAAAPLVPVDLRVVVENALNAERELLEKREIITHLRFPEDLPPVPGRARQLEIVFVNLIKNAVEAMSELPAGSPREIRIEAQSDGARVLVRVRDSGPGVRSEDKGKIFQPSFSTKGSYGTGMGLYLSSQIIQAHGGSIILQTNSVAGAEFVISL